MSNQTSTLNNGSVSSNNNVYLSATATGRDAQPGSNVVEITSDEVTVSVVKQVNTFDSLVDLVNEPSLTARQVAERGRGGAMEIQEKITQL